MSGGLKRDFFQGNESGLGLFEQIVGEGLESLIGKVFPELRFGGSGGDCGREFGIGFQEFEETDSADKAATGASGASDGAEDGSSRPFGVLEKGGLRFGNGCRRVAMGAEPADEALSRTKAKGCGDEVRGEPHIGEARHGCNGIVHVQG